MPRAASLTFAQRLLDWWDQNGRHDLPWQRPRTPYRVWISEIMLQQTQVGTVTPYFERWMQAFPDVPTLAAAPLDEVLSHWSGLGYYARARNVHRAAIRCVEDHGGDLPQGAEALGTLPGIGLSTANAILSQSTDQPAAVLDGNVRRVLARHAAVEGWTGQAAVQKQLWLEAKMRLPARRGADYTQAIMDLGAMLCTRSKPGCARCPVRGDCQARLRGLVSQLPTPKPATKVSDRTVHLLIVRDGDGRVLLEKRPPAGIWGGLWCLPDGESIDAIERRLGLAAEKPATLPRFEHRLSHVRMTICPVLADAAKPTQVQCPASRGWFERRQLPQLGLPKPVTDLLNRLHDGEFD